MSSLNGKVIVVTGGAGLLGKEFVRAIVEHGGVGIIADKNEEAGKRLEKTLTEKHKKKAEFIPLEITSEESVCDLIQRVAQKYKRIDALVNCAYPRNANYRKKFEDVAFDDFCENVNLHLGGYFLTSQQFALYFKKQGHGNIINMSSIYGVIPPRFEIYVGTTITCTAEYAAIKSAIIHLSKYMAQYFKNARIRVNCISAGGILDKQPKAFLKNYASFCSRKGMLGKQDLNGTLLYLLSDASQYVTGQNIVVDDGFIL